MAQQIEVAFEDLKLDDRVVILDNDHAACGARGRVYCLDQVTRMVSVVTDGYDDTWEGYADGVAKLVH